MKRLVAFAVLLLVPSPVSAADDPPGFWVTLKNECPGIAAADVSDRICGVTIGSASFNRIVHSGEVAPGFTAKINLCAGKDGQGLVQFSPSNPALAPAFVPVKPDGTVVYPQGFCKK